MSYGHGVFFLILARSTRILVIPSKPLYTMTTLPAEVHSANRLVPTSLAIYFPPVRYRLHLVCPAPNPHRDRRVVSMFLHGSRNRSVYPLETDGAAQSRPGQPPDKPTLGTGYTGGKAGLTGQSNCPRNRAAYSGAGGPAEPGRQLGTPGWAFQRSSCPTPPQCPSQRSLRYDGHHLPDRSMKGSWL